MISAGVTVVAPRSVEGTTGSTTVPTKWWTCHLNPRTGRASPVFRTVWRSGSAWWGQDRGDCEGVEDVLLGGGERVGDVFESVGGAGALVAEAGEGAEDVLGGGAGSAAFGQECGDGA